MEQPKLKTSHFSGLEAVVLLMCFCICLTGALLLPMEQCPDEVGRHFLSNWIVRTGTLPTGNELETMLMSWEDVNAPVLKIESTDGYDGWGFSYALRPYLASIVGAAFERIASCFTDSPRILLAASRMCSVLSVTFCCFFCLRLGRRLFARQSAALLFAVCVCFLPQGMFLGMYQNNDSLALCAVSMMLYYLVEGYDRKWPVTSCIGLAGACSLGLLSYYTFYGWLMTGVVYCVVAVLTDRDIPDKGRLILKRTGLILGICVLLAGWFFIRNAYYHNGDLLGIASEKVSRAEMRGLGYRLYEYVNYQNEGMTIPDFLRMGDQWWMRLSAWSFVGVFGYMDILLPRIQYKLYGAVIAGGALLYFWALVRQKPSRRDSLLTLTMLLASLLTVLMHFWQSYARDFQPQGRYVITLILPLAYMMAYGADKLPERWNARFHPAALLTAGWLSLFVWAALGTMSKMLM